MEHSAPRDGGHRRTCSRLAARGRSVRRDEVNVSELMPQILLPHGILVSPLNLMGGQEGRQQVEMTGLRLVQACKQAIHRAQSMPKP